MKAVDRQSTATARFYAEEQAKIVKFVFLDFQGSPSQKVCPQNQEHEDETDEDTRKGGSFYPFHNPSVFLSSSLT